MANGAVIVQGEVLDINHRQGTSERGPWAFDIVSILAGKTVQEVRFDQDTQGGVPSEGDNVALEVKLSSYKGFVQATAVKYHTPDKAAALKVS
jgi:hypothetical protein